MSKFIEEGWKFLIDDEKLMLISKNSKEFSYPIHKIKSSDSKYDIFRRFLPHSLLIEILNKRVEERKGGLGFNKGNGRFYTIKKHFYSFACFYCKHFDSGPTKQGFTKAKSNYECSKSTQDQSPSYSMCIHDEIAHGNVFY